MNEYKLKEGSSVILDLIRGVTAQIVVVGHAIVFFGIFTFIHEPNFPPMEHIAVLIFFILSGFLIPYSTVNKILIDNNYDFRKYLADRFSRIYTAFIPAIIFVLSLDLVSKSINAEIYRYSNAFNLMTFIGNIFMIQDYPLFALLPHKLITSFGSARPFWTLAVEWWIYMLFGYLLLVFLKNNKVSISSIIIVSFLSIVPVFNLILGRGNGLTTYWIFGSIVYVLSTLNILKDVNQKLKPLIAVVISGLALFRAYYLMEAYDPIFAFLLAIILWLIIDISKDKSIPNYAKIIIKYNASYSYTLYLVHYSILAFTRDHFSGIVSPYILFMIAITSANVVSILIGRYTELSLTKKVKLFLYNKIDNR